MSTLESCANLGRVNQQVQYYNICLNLFNHVDYYSINTMTRS